MPDTVTSGEQVAGWLSEAGFSPGPLDGPRKTEAGPLSIVVDGRAAESPLIVSTLSSLLRGTAQRSRIQVLLATDADSALFEEWIAHEPQISLPGSLDDVTPGDSWIMVVPAGVIAGIYSVEAAVECLHVSGAAVLRILVDGTAGSVELWRTEALGDPMARPSAEREARRTGAERWISGASVGMRAAGYPEPKMFLRKGSAGKFEVQVLVRDTARADVRKDYEIRIRELEAQLARAKREAWAPARGSSGRGTVVLRAMKKGPRYILNRASRRLMLRLTERS